MFHFDSTGETGSKSQSKSERGGTQHRSLQTIRPPYSRAVRSAMKWRNTDGARSNRNTKTKNHAALAFSQSLSSHPEEPSHHPMSRHTCAGMIMRWGRPARIPCSWSTLPPDAPSMLGTLGLQPAMRTAPATSPRQAVRPIQIVL